MQLKKWVIKNKYKLIAGSAFFAGLVTIPPVVGAIQANELRKNNDNRYIYKPGEVRFDENGKLIIPEVIDKDNLNGNYKHTLDKVNTLDMNNELFNSQKFQNDLKSNLKKILNSLLDNKKYEMNFEFEITNDIKLLVKNLITNKDIDFENTMNINDFLNVIIDSTINNPDYDVLTQYNPIQLCALSGINLDKEYNNIMEEANVEYNFSLFGGGGSLPSKPSTPEFGNPNNVDLHNITIKQYCDDVLSQNEYYQYIFIWTYGTILPIFIIINTILNILNLFTISSLTMLIIQTIADIVFCTIQIYQAITNYEQTINLKNKIADIIKKSSKSDEIMNIINWSSPASSFFSLNSSVFEYASLSLKEDIKKFFSFNSKFTKQFHISISIAKLSISILSLAFSTTMIILEGNLIKNV